jgi:hypothetical protein
MWACHLQSLCRLWCAVMSHRRCSLHCRRRCCASRVPTPTAWRRRPRVARSTGGAPSHHPTTGRSLPVAPRWSIVCAPSDVERAKSAPARTPYVERALLPGRPHWLVGRASRPPVYARQATRHKGRCRPGPRADFSPVTREFKKILFYFSFGFKLNSNFKNLYPNIQSSKSYEISSVGFIIFDLSNKIIQKSRNIFLESISIKTRITLHYLIYAVVIMRRTRRRWAHSEGGEGLARGSRRSASHKF